MKRNLLLMFSSIVLLLASCGKDDPNPGTKGIQGTYKLKFISAKTNSTITGTDGQKMITLSEYTSINNAGTIVIDGTKFLGTGLSYEVNSTAKAYYYMDNELIDSISSPFSVIIPPTNSTSPYKVIGTDSIYFQNGGLTSGIAGNVNNGGRYTLSGNLLTLKNNYSSDSLIQESGETYHKVQSAQITIVMDKQ